MASDSTSPVRLRTSVASTHSVRQRKFSTDRYYNQARRSILNEEKRTATNLVLDEEPLGEQHDPNHVQFSTPDFEAEKITSLSRAATGLSPLEMHPGDRVKLKDLMPFRFGSLGGAYFPEPNGDDSGQVPVSVRRVGTQASDVEGGHRHDFLSSAEEAGGSLINSLYRQLRRNKIARPEVVESSDHAIQQVSSYHDQFPHQIRDNRHVLYVLEYDKGHDGMLRCTRPNNSKSYDNVDELQDFLEKSTSRPMLRIIYACNVSEAVTYLTEAFGIDDSSLRGTDKSFRDWIETSRTQRGASNKVIRWRPSWDQARDVICTAFGLDFGSIVSQTPTSHPHPKQWSGNNQRKKDTASTKHEVLPQRLSVYLQRSLSATLPGPRVTRFKSGVENGPAFTKANTMIIFEYSSGRIGEIVEAPELLGLYSGFSVGDHTPETAAPWIMEGVLIHIYERVSQIWRDQISLIHEDHAHLEDVVFDDPSDERHAGEVWTMLEYLHDMAKLVNRHEALIDGFQEHFGHFAERDEEQEWLDNTIADLVELGNELQRDYIEPLNSMIDLIYKSVTIRDSRQALDLSASLWRLSWITFIFLPLTFLSGFFGMNVDTFTTTPSIKWYFVAAVSLLMIVYFLWYGLRLAMPTSYAPRSVRYSDKDVLRLRNTADILRNQQIAM